MLKTVGGKEIGNIATAYVQTHSCVNNGTGIFVLVNNGYVSASTWKYDVRSKIIKVVPLYW